MKKLTILLFLFATFLQSNECIAQNSILENKYTDELSRTMSYGIIGSTTPVNKQNIVNLPGVISYDFVFQLIPPQPIPRYICYDTYATNNIFYIDPSNLNITGLNSGIGDTSFILWLWLLNSIFNFK